MLAFLLALMGHSSREKKRQTERKKEESLENPIISWLILVSQKKLNENHFEEYYNLWPLNTMHLWWGWGEVTNRIQRSWIEKKFKFEGKTAPCLLNLLS